MPAFDLSSLNCLYFFLLMVGVFYALFVLVAGGLHSIHLPGFDLDLSGLHLPGDAHVDISHAVGGHEVSILSLSPISIAAFITSFGGIGLIATQGFRADGGASLIGAVIGSIAIAIVSHVFFFYIFIAPQASSAVQARTLIGATAEVTVAMIGASVGEIAYIAMGERHTNTARSADGTDIARGAEVTIERIAGTVMIVKAK
ncbi:MAG: NfeD family protein [Chloroflexi bacterium]|nr:NfeD family protein [Chloroflexota bacterium]